jgi:molybdate transport system substrate-binding protein
MAASCAASFSMAAAAFAQAPAAPSANPAAAAETRPAFAAYKPGDVRVYLSPALRVAMDKARPHAEAALGRKLVIEMSQAALLQKGIESGQPFEVALLTKPAMDEIVAKGFVAPETHVKLAQVSLGMAARGDLSKVDVKTAASLKSTMLGAKTIRRNYGVGASVPLVEHMIKTLQVEDAIKDKIIPMGPGIAPVPNQPLTGSEYELVFNMASELPSYVGWSPYATLPQDVRLPTQFAAGVGPKGDRALGEALMTFLKGPVFTQALVDSGMEPIS